MSKHPDRRSSQQDPSQQPLPKVNVRFASASASGQLTPENLRAMFCNPIYAGIGPYPTLVDDEDWVRAAARMIRDEGPEQFLVNMLYVLRQSLGTGAPESGDQ
jgi:hypothetical protein